MLKLDLQGVNNMPCYDGRGNDNGDLNIATRQLGAVQDKLDKRTDMLCRTLKSLKENVKHIYDVLPKDIREWHREHEALDRLREKNVKIEEKK